MSKREKLLLVDGYNVLNAQRPGLTREKIDDARDELTALLTDYAGYTGQRVIVVYDAWLSDRRARTVENTGKVQVVFTQKGETADHYIERLADGYQNEVAARRIELRVATSDLVEQTVVLGRGAIRLSARELLCEIKQAREAGKAGADSMVKPVKSIVMERLPADVRQRLEQMRRGG